MAKKKRPLLKAIKHNWGLMGPGDWRDTKWLVFPDGSYEVVSTFNPSLDDIKKSEENPELVEKKMTDLLKQATDALKAEKSMPTKKKKADILKQVMNALKPKRPRPVKKKTTGQMDEEVFSRLQEALICEPWRDPSLEVFACDGVAWEIESYREDGTIEKTSGKLGYIYGHKVLEKIVSLLPSDEGYDASGAFVSAKDSLHNLG